jgi:hypothetical protein
MHFPPTEARASTEAVMAEEASMMIEEAQPCATPVLRSSRPKGEANHVVWILR